MRRGRWRCGALRLLSRNFPQKACFWGKEREERTITRKDQRTSIYCSVFSSTRLSAPALCSHALPVLRRCMRSRGRGNQSAGLLLFPLSQFERCGRRKRAENLRRNTILIFGMLGWVSTQRYKITLPTLIIPPHEGQALAQSESCRHWLWHL